MVGSFFYAIYVSYTSSVPTINTMKEACKLVIDEDNYLNAYKKYNSIEECKEIGVPQSDYCTEAMWCKTDILHKELNIRETAKKNYYLVILWPLYFYRV